MKEHSYTDMDNAAYRTAYLIAGFIRNTLSEKEHDELDSWVNESDHNMKLFEDLTDEKNITANLEWMDKVQTEQSYQAMQEKGAFKVSPKKFYNKKIWLAAASVIVLLGVFFVYRYTASKPGSVKDIATTDTTLLKPGGNRATLTLADGKVIDLTYAKTGAIESDSGSLVNKTADGELVYVKGSGVTNTAALHTLSTPVGGQYQITLADGTRVWLNAASTIKYPSSFTGNERKVVITGEAYFEVAKNDKKPFRVLMSDSTAVLVTGTHFNINAYQNQKEEQVTLLEGSVTITNEINTIKLEPGTQASVTNKEITKSKVLQAEGITGWKDGLFVFHDAPIESIMMQLERWYDAKIIYKANIKQLFNATILRKEPLAKVLKLLELNGYVHFKTENNIIYVLP
jgi:ferric-dicitrate binding protein FerR (iron transport regulator)